MMKGGRDVLGEERVVALKAEEAKDKGAPDVGKPIREGLCFGRGGTQHYRTEQLPKTYSAENARKGAQPDEWDEQEVLLYGSYGSCFRAPWWWF